MEFLNEKKIKEIKDYAKADVKWFVRNGKEYFERDPKDTRYASIENYYEWLCQQSEERKERLISRFGYTDETLKLRAEIYHEAFWSSWKWWQKKMVENETVMAKYKPIFDEAEKIAHAVDVSDIQDGFPCGGCVIYLKPEAKNTDLGKVLRSNYSGDSYSAKVCHQYAYKLPIKTPTYGQCVAFDRRICEKVADFLNSKGVPTGVYEYID